MLGYFEFTIGLPNVKHITQFTEPGLSLLTLAAFTVYVVYTMQYNF